MQQFENAREAALALRPDEPVYCFRPEVLKADARQFMEMFPGKTAYAVKTNGEQIVLKALVEAGVTAFDVASPGEFAAVRAVSPDAEMLYMHPVKAQSDIRLALEKYGIRVIAIDHEDEIAKLTRIVRALDIDPGAITSSCACRPRGWRPTSCRRNSAPVRRMRWNSPSGCTAPATRSGCASMSAARSRTPTPTSGRLPRPTGCATGSSFELAGLDVGGGFPAEYGHDPNRKQLGNAVAWPAHVAAVAATSRNMASTRCRWSPSRAA